MRSVRLIPCLDVTAGRVVKGVRFVDLTDEGDPVELAARYDAECAENGAGEILLTSMDRDGTRDGFDLALTRAVVDAVDVPVVASGGVGRLQDLVDGAVEGGADAVLAASIFHRREFTIGEAKTYMAERGVTVRPV